MPQGATIGIYGMEPYTVVQPALTGLRAAHPPAIAGGTDPVQGSILTFEAVLNKKIAGVR